MSVAKKQRIEGPFEKLFNEKYTDPGMFLKTWSYMFYWLFSLFFLVDEKKRLKNLLFSSKPFPHLQIPDFIQDKAFVEELEREVPQRVSDQRNIHLVMINLINIIGILIEK